MTCPRNVSRFMCVACVFLCSMRLRQLSIQGRQYGQPPTHFRMEEHDDLEQGHPVLTAWQRDLAEDLHKISTQDPSAWKHLLQCGGILETNRHEERAPTEKTGGAPHSNSNDTCIHTIGHHRTDKYDEITPFIDMMYAILTCNSVMLEPVNTSNRKNRRQKLNRSLSRRMKQAAGVCMSGLCGGLLPTDHYQDALSQATLSQHASPQHALPHRNRTDHHVDAATVVVPEHKQVDFRIEQQQGHDTDIEMAGVTQPVRGADNTGRDANIPGHDDVRSQNFQHVEHHDGQNHDQSVEALPQVDEATLQPVRGAQIPKPKYQVLGYIAVVATLA